MSIEKSLFGTLSDGKQVFAYTLRNANGMSVKIITYGGALVELRVPDKNGCFADVIGGYDCIESYVGGDGYQGALIGRVANRIAKGKFELDGKSYSLYINDNDNHLHGGQFGYNAKVWDAEPKDSDEPELHMHLLSPDMEEGYPGNLDINVVYKLTKNNGLLIDYTANTDKTTVLNLTNHAYFNLGGYASGTIHNHMLQLYADTYLVSDDQLIPTGEIKSVEGTPFDFRTAKRIGDDIASSDNHIQLAGGYDHCFNLVGGETDAPVKRGELYDAESGRVMEIYTNQPCVQFYSGNFLTNAKYPFKGGYRQSRQTLMCFETQKMPDSINHSNFTDCVLRPDQTYRHTTEYRFSVK